MRLFLLAMVLTVAKYGAANAIEKAEFAAACARMLSGSDSQCECLAEKLTSELSSTEQDYAIGEITKDTTRQAEFTRGAGLQQANRVKGQLNTALSQCK